MHEELAQLFKNQARMWVISEEYIPRVWYFVFNGKMQQP